MDTNEPTDQGKLLPGWLRLAFQPEPRLGDIEAAYQHTIHPEDAGQVRFMAGIYILAALLFIYFDHQLQGSTQGIWVLTFVRAVMILASVGIILAVGKLSEPGKVGRAVLAWELLIVAGVLIINFNRPESFFYHTALDIVILMAIYLAIPNRFIYRVLPALVFTLGELFLYTIFQKDVSPIGLRSFLVALLLVNLIGWLMSVRLYTLRRLQFKSQYEERLAKQEVERLAMTDTLTPVYNRRRFLELLNREFQRYQRTKHVFSIVLIDLDHFKSINEIYGHTAGDAVLIQFAEMLNVQIRKVDTCARLGGEEFALLLPETDEDKAMEAAERLRTATEALAVKTEVGELVFTISIGVTEVLPEDVSVDPLLSRADRALYRAKENGRNRIERWVKAG